MKDAIMDLKIKVIYLVAFSGGQIKYHVLCVRCWLSTGLATGHKAILCLHCSWFIHTTLKSLTYKYRQRICSMSLDNVTSTLTIWRILPFILSRILHRTKKMLVYEAEANRTICHVICQSSGHVSPLDRLNIGKRERNFFYNTKYRNNHNSKPHVNVPCRNGKIFGKCNKSNTYSCRN
jgi:hypothetical protein